MVYTSIDNEKIKDIKKLNQKKYRELYNQFLIEGEHLVKEAFKNNALTQLIIRDDAELDINTNKMYVNDKVLKYISELDNPSNIMGICTKIKEKPLGTKILILDNIQDPGNLGTIIRSAVAFNIDTVVLSENCVDLYNSKVLRATQGMIFNINIVKRNIKEFTMELKEKDYKIYGTKVNGGKSLKKVEKCEKFAIIMGNEGHGVSDNILELCNEYIYIDMNDKCESLNVAVATSIILYELDVR